MNKFKPPAAYFNWQVTMGVGSAELKMRYNSADYSVRKAKNFLETELDDAFTIFSRPFSKPGFIWMIF